MYTVYVELDKNNSVIKIFSDLFEEPSKTAVEIDKGEGERFAHAQSQYLDKPVLDAENRPNFKYGNGVLSLLSKEEKEKRYPKTEPQKTEIALLKEEVAMLNETIDVILFDVIPDITVGYSARK